jgi:hypothetical protein
MPTACRSGGCRIGSAAKAFRPGKLLLKQLATGDFSQIYNGEWYVGFANVSGSSVFGGALLSYASGFTWSGPGGVPTPTPGLVCGSYTGQNMSEITETTATNFPAIVPNTWYDLIILWTPTAINYYGAQYGTSPVLIGTHSAATPGGPNIYTGGQYLHASNNMYTSGPNVNLYIDLVEWLSKPRRRGVCWNRICSIFDLSSGQQSSQLIAE